jgi:tripartite-type tricarboxylate transporter receptor subunit TctC
MTLPLHCSLSRRRTMAAALALASVSLGSASVQAQGVSGRPVRMLVPFAVGGPTDLVARIAAQHMSEVSGRTVVVDNRAGAGGTIAVETAIRATPDGDTLLFGSSSTFAVNPAIMRSLPYNVERDLRLVGLCASAPQLLVVRPGIAANNVAELVALAKRQPGKLTFASSGAGTIIHMAGELFKHSAGIDIVHVPYKGGGPATVAMMVGEVDMMLNSPGPLMPNIKTGKLKALAVAGKQRSVFVPDIPTFAEAGLPQVESDSAFALAAPIGTPPAVVRALGETLAKASRRPDYKDRLAVLGYEPAFLSPEQSAEFFRREFEKWARVAKAANVRVD